MARKTKKNAMDPIEFTIINESSNDYLLREVTRLAHGLAGNTLNKQGNKSWSHRAKVIIDVLRARSDASIS